jgi:hypothetical protein
VLHLLRIVNAFAAALFLVMALVSVAFLSAARDGLGRGTPSLWISAGWAAMFALLAALSFVNLRRAGAGAGGGRGLVALNLLAALPLLAGLLAADPVARILCGASALPFALTALLLAARRNG